eukprot:5696459-Amphidinium_carterae.1
METMMAILGWEVAGDDKSLPFKESFDILGVECRLHLHHSPSSFEVCNRRTKIDELEAMIDKAIEEQKLTRAEASTLSGRLQFARGQLVGNHLNEPLRQIQTLAHEGRSGERLSSRELDAMESSSQTPVLVAISVDEAGSPREIGWEKSGLLYRQRGSTDMDDQSLRLDCELCKTLVVLLHRRGDASKLDLVRKGTELFEPSGCTVQDESRADLHSL